MLLIFICNPKMTKFPDGNGWSATMNMQLTKDQNTDFSFSSFVVFKHSWGFLYELLWTPSCLRHQSSLIWDFQIMTEEKASVVTTERPTRQRELSDGFSSFLQTRNGNNATRNLTIILCAEDGRQLKVRTSALLLLGLYNGVKGLTELSLSLSS